MRRKLHGYTGQQWDFCYRCGQLFPMPELTMQKGSLVCTECVDNLDVERRNVAISRALGSGIDREGTDRRQDHWTFFSGWEHDEG